MYRAEGVKAGAGFITGNGVVTYGADSTQYDPTLAAGGPGTVVIDTVLFQYLGADSITVFTITEYISVYNLGIATISGLDPEYCEDADTALLFGTPIAGVFTGSGITVNDFVPPDAAIGTDSITYTYIDPISSCLIDTTVTTIVHLLPVVTFVSYQADSQYCDNDPLDTLIGVPLGGAFSSPGIVIPALSSLDTVVLNALASPTGVGIVTYTYTDSNTCVNSFTVPITIDTIPSLSISSLNSEYCIDAIQDIVSGIVGSSFGSGGFYGAGIVDSDTTDGTAFFEPDSAGVGNGTLVTFYFTDLNGCSNVIDMTTDVKALPIVSIVGLDSAYCKDDPATLVLGSPPSTGLPTDGFSGGGITNSSGIYIPDIAGVGLDTVIYTYTDGFGCVNSDTAYSMINSNPTPAFTISSSCIADSIQFFDNSTLDPASTDTVVVWSWDFGDPFSGLANTSTLENPKHLYNVEGLKSIDLEVTTNQGCVGTLNSQTINLGTNPTANFTWTDECFGLDSVHFNNISISNSLTDSVTYVWDFGDGDTVGQTLTNPAHHYDSILSYSVSLTLNTTFSCNHTVTKTLTIRPNIVVYPYFQDFENGHGGWVADAADTVVGYSWELGTPNNTIISSAYSGTSAWVTNLDSNYYNGENSWVLGPCFDFTSLTKPMIIFKLITQTPIGIDGSVLQYTTNDTLWNNVGTINDGIEWYNDGGIVAGPGNQTINPQGWAGSVKSNWVEVRNELDVLVGEPYVRLRIAFASITASNEGIAFDDIWIGERTRTVLIEHFTNSSDANSASQNPSLNNIINSNPLDIIDVQYHTNFPGEDPMNIDNPADPSARALFYGVSSTPFTIMDGDQFKDATFLFKQTTLDLRKLEDPQFDIDLSSNIAGGALSITAKITANDTLIKNDISLHLVAIEKLITSITGVNGEVVFESVMKKMIPTSAGTKFIQDWFPGDNITVIRSWTMENYYDMNEAAVVAFVQNNDTKEVYQAAANDSNTITTAIDNLIFNNQASLDFVVYPNPAEDRANVAFNMILKEASRLTIYSVVGTLVDAYEIPRGTHALSLPTATYPNGIYLVSVRDQEGLLITKRMVIHH